MKCRPEDLKNDRVLLREVLAGDPRAWARFRRRYQPILTMCVRRVAHHHGARLTPHDAEDIVADIWLLLILNDCRRLRAFDPTRRCRLGTWLGAIAGNHTIDMLRRRRRRPIDRPGRSANAWLQRAACQARRPDTMLERRRQRARLGRALMTLPEADRQFVHACFREEQTTAELAANHGIAINTVYSRKHKVVRKLARTLASPPSAALVPLR